MDITCAFSEAAGCPQPEFLVFLTHRSMNEPWSLFFSVSVRPCVCFCLHAITLGTGRRCRPVFFAFDFLVLVLALEGRVDFLSKNVPSQAC